MNHTTKLFESIEDDTPVWVGLFNGTTIEIYERDDTGAEEVYASPAEGRTLEQAACDLAAFLDSAQPEDYEAHRNITEEGEELVVTVGTEPWTSFVVETDENGTEVVVGDIQIDDAEMDYLQVNGVLPDPDKFGDAYSLDLSNPEEDFWLNGKA